MENDIEIDVIDLLNFLRKKAAIILLVALIFGICGFGFSKFCIVPQYQSSSMIYITSGSNGTVVQNMLSELQAGTALTADYKTLVQSKPVLNQVIEDLNLEMEYEELRDAITVENPENTRILTISVKNPDPKLAKDIVDDLTDVVIYQIADIMNTSKPNILQSGDIAKEPIFPSNGRVAFDATLLALVIMLAYFFIQFIQNDMITSNDDIEKYLNQKNLVQVPEFKYNEDEDKKEKKLWPNRKK